MGQNLIWKSFLLASQNDWNNLSEGLYENVTLKSANMLISKFPRNNLFDIPNLTLESGPRAVVISLGVIYQIADLITAFFWVFTFCGLYLWGALFVKLFETFVAKVELCKSSGNGVLQVQ